MPNARPDQLWGWRRTGFIGRPGPITAVRWSCARKRRDQSTRRVARGGRAACPDRALGPSETNPAGQPVGGQAPCPDMVQRGKSEERWYRRAGQPGPEMGTGPGTATPWGLHAARRGQSPSHPTRDQAGPTLICQGMGPGRSERKAQRPDTPSGGRLRRSARRGRPLHHSGHKVQVLLSRKIWSTTARERGQRRSPELGPERWRPLAGGTQASHGLDSTGA